MGWAYAIQNRSQYYADKLKPQFGYRWMATFVLECVYAIQLYLHGCSLVFIFLGVILAALVILLGRMLQASFILFACYVVFRVDPPFSSDAPPIRPLFPEFRLWCCVNTVLFVALPMTFIPELNIDLILPWIKYLYFVKYLYFGVWIYFASKQFKLFGECMDKCKYLSFDYGDKIKGDNNGKLSAAATLLCLV
ncbi:hypothetical protein CASFOL_020704 [Castilleja foliolosa]|uniref:Uncharacterized protein n=1 Tax=Castilleja foliolosa TaxID=1961234 RepID=A0ABD3D340_9LAMI